MTDYHFRFMKTVYDSTGHPHRCVEGVVDIYQAKNKDRALQAAKYRFERMKGISHWDLYADTVELDFDQRADVNGRELDVVR